MKKEKKRVFCLKAIQFWKNNSLLTQSPFPLKHQKSNNSSALCRMSSRLHLESFSHLQIPCLRNPRGLAVSQSQFSSRGPLESVRASALFVVCCPFLQQLPPGLAFAPHSSSHWLAQRPCTWLSRVTQCQLPILSLLLRRGGGARGLSDHGVSRAQHPRNMWATDHLTRLQGQGKSEFLCTLHFKAPAPNPMFSRNT